MRVKKTQNPGSTSLIFTAKAEISLCDYDSALKGKTESILKHSSNMHIKMQEDVQMFVFSFSVPLDAREIAAVAVSSLSKIYTSQASCGSQAS